MTLFSVSSGSSQASIARKVFAVGVGVLATTGLLLGCAAENPEPPEQPEAEMEEPIITSISELPDEHIELTVGNLLSIDTEEASVDEFAGSVDQPEVAEFIAGYVNEDAEFNPAVEALSPGEAEVTVTNTETEESFTFTVRVTR